MFFTFFLSTCFLIVKLIRFTSCQTLKALIEEPSFSSMLMGTLGVLYYFEHLHPYSIFEKP
jgi:hypothetical protein